MTENLANSIRIPHRKMVVRYKSSLPVSLVGLIAIGSERSEDPDLVTQATCEQITSYKIKKDLW